MAFLKKMVTACMYFLFYHPLQTQTENDKQANDEIPISCLLTVLFYIGI